MARPSVTPPGASGSRSARRQRLIALDLQRHLLDANVTLVTCHAMMPAHWPAVRDIYLEGIATGNATFETEAPTWLHRKAGFREVGRRERIGQLHGLWRDTLLLERRAGGSAARGPSIT